MNRSAGEQDSPNQNNNATARIVLEGKLKFLLSRRDTLQAQFEAIGEQLESVSQDEYPVVLRRLDHLGSLIINLDGEIKNINDQIAKQASSSPLSSTPLLISPPATPPSIPTLAPTATPIPPPVQWQKLIDDKRIQTALLLVFMLFIILIVRSCRPPVAMVIPPSYQAQTIDEIHPFALSSHSLYDWINDTVDIFHKAGGVAEGNIIPYGTRDAKQVIFYGAKIRTHNGKGQAYLALGKPQVLCVDDPYWIYKLNSDWKNIHGGNDIIYPNSVQSLFHTRLLFAMSTNRSQQFRNALDQPQFRGKYWKLLAILARDGWGAIDPGSAGKPCKILMGDPVHTHAGLASLILMLAEYVKEHPNAQSSDPGFIKLLKPLAQNAVTSDVNSPLPPKQLGEDMIVVSYESDACQWKQNNAPAEISVIYPIPTLDMEFSAAQLISTNADEQAHHFLMTMTSSENLLRASNQGFRVGGQDNFHRPDLIESGFQSNAPFVSLITINTPRSVFDVQTGKIAPSFATLNDLPYEWYILANGRVRTGNYSKTQTK